MYRVLVLLRIDGDRKKPIEQWMSLTDEESIRYNRDASKATRFLTYDRAVKCVELTQHDIDIAASHPERHLVMIEQYITHTSDGNKTSSWVTCFSDIQGAVGELVQL